MTEILDLQKLVELLNPPKENSSSDDEDLNNDEEEQQDKKKLVTGKKSNLNSPYNKITPQRSEYDETTFEQEENNDWKQNPKYEISYKQKVTPEDMYLGVGNKTTSTASCEDMIISVHLPGEKFQNMDLKVFTKEIKLTSPKFYLDLPLPQPVDPQKGNAQWDKNQEKLIITLRMDREFDFINF